jgi:hypothetical protein
MENNLNHNKALLLPALVVVLMITACNSNTAVFSTPTISNSSGVVQQTMTPVTLPTSTMSPGKSQNNPAPFGSTVHADNMKFLIKGTVRPADGIVSSGDIFNVQPGQWKQYIFVTIEVTCETSTDQQCHFSPFSLKLIGSDGVTNYPERFISGVDSILVDTIFQGGATISGNIPFIIFIGDSRLALGYDSQSGESYYLSLP